MSRLQPGLIVLDKGLNLQTPKITAPEGSVLDSLNYEQVDFQGQKRIDGNERYDGHPLAELNDYDIFQGISLGTLVKGDLLCNAESTIIGVVLALDTVSKKIEFALINPNPLPPVAGTMNLFKFSNGAATLITTATYLGKGRDSGITEDIHYTTVLAHNTYLRERVGTLPGAVAGLHWFNDRLYAVADMDIVAVQLNTSTGIYPNDTLDIPGQSLVFSVVDAVTYGDIVYVLSPKPYQIDTSNTDNVQKGGVTIGHLLNTASFPVWPPAPITASFFEAKSIQQTIDEEVAGYLPIAGWHFIHHGWQVNFDKGDSLFGSLPSLNQNIQNLGTQGPTSTSGSSGKAGVLTQKGIIAGKQAQVNGWKSSNTPTSYQLEANNIEATDAAYIYADAFISWSGSNTVVSAPGITTGALPEYSASATIEVEIL